MSQEWLKKLAELSNDKDLLKRAQQMQARPAQAPKPRPVASGSRSGLFGAAFGSFFRYLLLFAAGQAAAMMVVAGLESLENEPWGLIYHHTVWYPLTQQIFPDAIYGLLRDWFGVAPDDLAALYERINGVIQKYQDELVFLTPVAAALVLTLFFLPSINARRRQSPIRFLVFLANIAVLALVGKMGPGVIVIWLAAFAFSFAGGVRAAPKARPAPSGAQAVAAAAPQVSGSRAVPAMVQQRAARPSAASAKDRAVERREGVSGSWIRAR